MAQMKKKAEDVFEDTFEVWDVLEDMAATLETSKYRRSFTYIGGFALISRLNDRYRRTRDIDVDVTTPEIWEDFVENAADLFTSKSKAGYSYRVLKRRYHSIKNCADTLYFGVVTKESRVKVHIDMKIKEVLKREVVASSIGFEIDTCPIEEVIADKLSVVFSQKSHKRIKDSIDLMHIFKVYDKDICTIRKDLEGLGFDFDAIEIEHVINDPNYKNAYVVFVGLKNKLPIEVFYKQAWQLFVPMGYLLKEGTKNATFDKERGLWILC